MSGIGGHNAAESVVTLERNEWSLCGGIRIFTIFPIFRRFIFLVHPTKAYFV
jgi:hypothetical protein